MKKVICVLAMLAGTFTMYAQTKFHDIEFNEASGPVKCIKSSVMGQQQTINFTQDGKMQSDAMSDIVYDADGYIQSASMNIQGQSLPMKYKWENGKVVSQTMSMMGQEMEIKFTYNDKGARATQVMDMGGQVMDTPFTDYKYDDRGNWISRKMSMMGQEMEQTRTIEYYE